VAAHYYQYDTPRIDRNWDFWQHSEEGRVNGILQKLISMFLMGFASIQKHFNG
jgi:lysozyme